MPDFDLDASLAEPMEKNQVFNGEPVNGVGPYRPGWRERLGDWLFRPCARHQGDLARFEIESRAAQLDHTLFIHAQTTFSWPDRLRLLFSGRLIVRTVIQTANHVGAHLTIVQMRPLPPEVLDVTDVD